jgi:undecaprenyl-diphosphatase
MLAIQSLILGVFQGLSEFIPISSSAHLIIIPWLFGWNSTVIESATFDIALHIGSLLAIIVFFASDIWRLILAWFKSVAERKIGEDKDRRMAWYLLIATVPGGVAGSFLERSLMAPFRAAPIPRPSMIFLALAIALLGVLMWLADKLVRHDRGLGGLSVKDALIIGLAQALAVFPGVSRSGATITAGLALGLERESAARFSFLLSVPLLTGAALKSIGDISASFAGKGIGSSEFLIFWIGSVAAGITGLLCIQFILIFLRKRSTRAFAWYRLALAILVLAVAIGRG